MGRVDTLRLTDFRCYPTADLVLAGGVTVIGGANGQGKTSLLEAVHWVATTRSFRGVPNKALVRAGAETAIVRAHLDAKGRAVDVEAELRAGARDRVLVNRQPLRRTRDLLGVLRVTVFAPDDLQLIKGGPSLRRQYLDDLLVATAPRFEQVRADLEKVLKHRTALLRRGVRDEDDRRTLDVFDDQLVTAGATLVEGRLALVEGLFPEVAAAYRALAGGTATPSARYDAEWAGGTPDPEAVAATLRRALEERRGEEIDRRACLVGPQRDDWHLGLDGLDARYHASQGEQRSFALALRLGGHRRVAGVVDDEPVLLLDDVFSELDPARSRALVEGLPPAQTLVTTAVPLPEGIEADARFEVREGHVEEAA